MKAFGPFPDTDGESMTPEPYRPSARGPDGLRVVPDLSRDDPDAILPTAGMLSG